MSDPGAGETPSLLERDVELETLSAAVREAAGGAGRVAIVEGHAGIGKSALLAAAHREAALAGARVLSAQGGELERELGFGVVRQLFARPVSESRAASRLLSGPARHAAPLLGVDAGARPAALAPAEAVAAALHGLHWLVVNLAEEGPLALLVDDLHWCDAASARFLAYLARRIEGLPVLLAVASRPAAGDDGAPLDALARTASARVIEPAPLSAAATRQVVRAFAPDAAEAACAAAHALTGGNPFFVTAVARELGSGAARDGALEEWSPAHATRAVRARLRGASRDARALARAASTLGASAELRHAAALGELPLDRAAAAADELRGLGILDPGRRTAFLHPILRAAIYDDLPPGRRAAAHERAARLMAGDGAAPEQVAVQLLGAERGGDAWACDRLRDAARASMARGAPEAAVAYLRRVLEEPPPADAVPQLLYELGTAEGLAFDVPAAAEHLRMSVERGTDRDLRVDAATMYALVQYLGGRGGPGVELLDGLRGDASGDEPSAERIEASVASLGSLHARTRPLARPCAERLRRRREAGGALSASAEAVLALELTMAGRERDVAVAYARRAIGALRASSSLMRDFELSNAIRCLAAADELDEAMRLYDDELEAATERGTPIVYAIWVTLRSSAAFRMGSVHAAEADARAGWEYLREAGSPTGVPASASYLIDALIERGELAEAEGVLADDALRVALRELEPVIPINLLLHSRARLRLARGETDEAIADALALRERQEAIEERNPALLPWRSTAALGLHRAGDVQRARELASDELGLARAFGAPRAIGIALRAAALVEGGERGRALLSEAVEVLANSPARLEHAHALAGLGELTLAADGPGAARPLLLEALELAHTCGATALETRVLDALHATGARPRRPVLSGPGALTPSERRVAEMVAGGRSNRDVAEALFVTVRTVESHLSTAYRKLGIGSRRELAAALEER